MIVASAFGAADQVSKKKAPVTSSKAAGKKPVTALQKSVAKKRAVTSSSAHKTASGKTAGHATAGRSTVRSASARSKTPAKPAVSWRNRQLQPTSDRYKEIQTALASKGYLPADQVTGSWNQNSTDALKQFQTTQNLDASGKINSLSLIALGLGPKHESAPVQVSQPADQSR